MNTMDIEDVIFLIDNLSQCLDDTIEKHSNGTLLKYEQLTEDKLSFLVNLLNLANAIFEHPTTEAYKDFMKQVNEFGEKLQVELSI